MSQQLEFVLIPVPGPDRARKLNVELPSAEFTDRGNRRLVQEIHRGQSR